MALEGEPALELYLAKIQANAAAMLRQAVLLHKVLLELRLLLETEQRDAAPNRASAEALKRGAGLTDRTAEAELF